MPNDYKLVKETYSGGEWLSDIRVCPVATICWGEALEK